MKLDWNEIVFKNKSELKEKKFIFISGFREISSKRLLELISAYLPKGNLLIGILKDDYIEGFENQPQFKTMSKTKVYKLVNKLSKSKLPNSLDTIEYFQKDLVDIINKIDPAQVIFINGSWSKTLHLRDEFFALVKNNIKYKLVSAFSSENEAKEFYFQIENELNELTNIDKTKRYSDTQLMEIAKKVSSRSFDWTFQVGALIATGGKILLSSHNKILPFETYAMHYGSSREKQFSPAGDLNNYDTIHAEASLIATAGNKKIDLTGSTMYIPLLPCPTCAKLIAQSNIERVVYSIDHSDGYAVKLLESMGKSCERVV